MRRCLLLCFIGMILFSSCAVNIQYPMPTGLWRSENPEFILDIGDDASIFYNGKFVSDSIEKDVVVFVNTRGSALQVFDADLYDISTQQLTTGRDNFIFIGGYRKRFGKLHYKLYSSTVEGIEIETIVFENVEGKVTREELFGELSEEAFEEAQQTNE